MFFNELKNKINEFAQKDNFKGAKYIGEWKEYRVYEPYMSNNETSYTGLPLVILVNEKNEIRWSTPDEAIATMNDESFLNSYESNYKTEEKIER